MIRVEAMSIPPSFPGTRYIAWVNPRSVATVGFAKDDPDYDPADAGWFYFTLHSCDRAFWVDANSPGGRDLLAELEIPANAGRD
jgi:hypothetical protein